MKKLKEVIEVVSQWVRLIMLIICTLVTFGSILKILEPLSMAITFLFVLVLTVHAFERKWLGIVSLFGIAIYILSWPVTGKYGLYIGLSVWTVGFFTWLWAVYRSFCISLRTA